MKEINIRKGIIPALVQIGIYLLMVIAAIFAISLVTTILSYNRNIQWLLIRYGKEATFALLLGSLCAGGVLTAVCLRKLGHGAFRPTVESNKLISIVLVLVGIVTLLFLGGDFFRVVMVIAGIFFWFWVPKEPLNKSSTAERRVF